MRIPVTALVLLACFQAEARWPALPLGATPERLITSIGVVHTHCVGRLLPAPFGEGADVVFLQDTDKAQCMTGGQPEQLAQHQFDYSVLSVISADQYRIRACAITPDDKQRCDSFLITLSQHAYPSPSGSKSALALAKVSSQL
ncbi:hypothetical protein [Ferrimonas marina]|uniref:Uncharacterized protein n=1 Tax=Ferrimonas marina TaxID=299255 RepID=A0A1M5U248_9GAMM|nr:hypothetical protein [Ferrimonas marina]SHH57048.1 hypothetical protein SAMN02745129_2374 [Ferrimonas marina]